MTEAQTADADMLQAGKVVETKGLWKKFFHLVRFAKIPWFGLVVYLLVNQFTVYVAVMLPQVESDVFTGNASVANIAWVIIVELASGLLVCVLLAAYGVIGGRIDRNFRNAIWGKILRLEPKYFDRVSANTLLSRMTDDAESMKDFILLIISEITGITTTAATLVAMTTMNKGLAVIMAVFVPVFLIFGFIVGRIKMRIGNSVKYRMADLTDYLSGQLARITVIKAYNKEAYEQARGEERIREYYIAQRKQQITDFLQLSIASTIHMVPDILLLLVGIYMLETNVLTPAGWIVFYAYANQILSFFSEKITVWISIKEYQGNMNRLTELFDAPEEDTRSKGTSQIPSGDLAFTHVSFDYDEKELLHDLSFTLPENAFTVILGPSGIGKTTILKLIERIYTPSGGGISLNGHEIQTYGIRDWRRSISYVKQDVPLISGTIRENILYGVERDYTDAQIMAAAVRVRADGFIRGCPGGLDYNVGQFGSRLSGGQKQKISVLRAFLQDRALILMDEPTASLDPASVQDVLSSVRALCGQKTVIMAAHDASLIRQADHIIVLEGASELHEGTFEEMLSESAFFRDMMRKDAEKERS